MIIVLDLLSMSWEWMTAHGLLMVLAVNIAVLTCAIGSAAYSVFVTRRVARLALAVDQGRHSVEILRDELYAGLGAIENRSVLPPASESGAEAVKRLAPGNSVRMDADFQEEVDSLRREISHIREGFFGGDLSATCSPVPMSSCDATARHVSEGGAENTAKPGDALL